MANQTLDPLADADLPADYMPERADMAEAKAKERTFRTGVTNDIYFKLEKESVERGIKLWFDTARHDSLRPAKIGLRPRPAGGATNRNRGPLRRPASACHMSAARHFWGMGPLPVQFFLVGLGWGGASRRRIGRGPTLRGPVRASRAQLAESEAALDALGGLRKLGRKLTDVPARGFSNRPGGES